MDNKKDINEKREPLPAPLKKRTKPEAKGKPQIPSHNPRIIINKKHAR
jgi:hypothetical protein